MTICFYSWLVDSLYTGKYYNHKIFIYSVGLNKKIKNEYDCIIYNNHHLWKYDFTEAHYSIFASHHGSPKKSTGAAYAASPAPVSTPMV